MNSVQSPQITITPTAASMLGVSSTQSPQIMITPAAASMIDMKASNDTAVGTLFGIQASASATPSPTYRFTNDFSKSSKGDPLCLDIINDGKNNKLIMSPCGNYSGQQWTYQNNKLQNNFSGQQSCLDIVNDGENNKLIMSPCGNYSGQQWHMS
jgi:hypothetical protein